MDPEVGMVEIPVTLLPEPEQPDDDSIDPADTHVEGVDAE